MFERFLGASILTNLFLFAAILIVFADFTATLFAIIYQRFWYSRLMRPKYGVSFSPSCSVLVPCKGIPKDFRKNLQGFLELDYREYEVIFVVESAADPASAAIKEIISQNSRAKLVIAGLATTCAQKNHNLLAALKAASNPEVYVFADSDIRPVRGWLRELVLPLAHQRIAATSGFRWLHATQASAGELTHSYINIFMYVLFIAACFIGGVGLWGGSMAIRRKDFEEMGVAKKWSRAAVDDMSLSQLVMKSSRKAVLVPACITHTDDLLQTVRGAVTWFERQIMFLKSYQRLLWIVAFPLAFCGLVIPLMLPISIIGSLWADHTFFGLGGGAALVFILGELITVSLYPLLGSMPRFHRFIMLQPFMRISHAISFLRTCSTNTITWAGIKYHLTFSGDVASIERPAQNE